MNRVDFMGQLESLLQGISPTEREEAIQYYNDYFDDAGKENEQEVIEALGNPARVAENIKRDLLGNGYGDKTARKAQASDRALMEYGQEGSGSAAAEPDRESAERDSVQGGSGTSGPGQEGKAAGQESARQDRNPFGGYGGNGPESAEDGSFRWKHDWAGWSDEPERPEKQRMPVWAVALLATVLVLASPVLAGLAIGAFGVVFGGLVSWFGLILCFGAAALALLLAFIVLVVAGILSSFTNPWTGMAMVGGGLICGCIGILFLMLTVAMAGIVTPAACRGIASLFRLFRKKRARTARA